MNKEQKYHIKQKQRKTAKRRLMIFLATLALAIGGCAAYGGFLLGTQASAKSEETPSLNKYYTSIEIQKGDSLWSIAQAYMTDEYESIHDYIDELKTINALESDNINESGFLTVAYYM